MYIIMIHIKAMKRKVNKWVHFRELRLLKRSKEIFIENKPLELHTDLVISDAMTCVHVTELEYYHVLEEVNMATY